MAARPALAEEAIVVVVAAVAPAHIVETAACGGVAKAGVAAPFAVLVMDMEPFAVAPLAVVRVRGEEPPGATPPVAAPREPAVVAPATKDVTAAAQTGRTEATPGEAPAKQEPIAAADMEP